MESLQKTLRRLFDVRPEEQGRVFLMFSYLMLVIGCYITTKSVRDALFLKKLGTDQLPIVYILIAVVVGFISSGYSRAASRFSLRTLIRTTSLIAISNLFLFWLTLGRVGGWLFYVLYIWVSVFGVITASQFWLLANYVFNPREAKRLFGLIGAGGLLGGILGGAFTRYGAKWFGTENLLLWCMGFMFLTLLLLEYVPRNQWLLGMTSNEEPGAGGETRHLLKLIFSSRHLTMLTAILGITVLVESFVDYQLKFLSDLHFSSQDQLTAFFGTLSIYLSALSLIFQISLTGRILKRFGVGASILFLPLGLFSGSLVLAIAPSLLAVGFLKISDGSFRYSIHRSGIELLYLPVPMSIKNQVKAFIDLFIDRLGRGIGGVLLILFSIVIPLSISQLSLLVCGMIGVWIYLSMKMRREYLNSFRIALEKKTIEPELLRVSIADSATLQPILAALASSDERQVLYALRLLEDVNPDLWLAAVQPLLQHASPRVRALAIERLSSKPSSDAGKVVSTALGDPDLAVRTEAVHYLSLMDGKPPERRLKEFLASGDYRVVGAAVHTVSKYRWDFKEIIGQEFIERALREEGPQRQAARTAAASALGLIPAGSPLHAFLNVLLEDESEQVVCAAIHSCRQVRSLEVLPLLIPKLANVALRNDVRSALLAYGATIVETLRDYMNDSQQALGVRSNIPKVLAGIDSQEAVNGLVRGLQQLDPFLRYRAIKALNKMRVHFPHLAFDDHKIDLAILEELRDYYQFGILLGSREMEEAGAQAAVRLLRRALQERMDQKLERVFRLLGLRYPPKDIYSAYSALRSQHSNVRASAVEFLDNLLLPDLKQLLFPILEDSSVDMFVTRGQRHFGLQRKTRVAYLEQFITSQDDWLQALSLYLAGDLGLIELLGAVRAAQTSDNVFVRQVADRSLALLQRPAVV